jgi:hypothetical protein
MRVGMMDMERAMKTVEKRYEEYYPVVVQFDKLLKRGVLNGLTVTDKVRFISEKDAVSWIEAVKVFAKGCEYSNFKIEKTRKRDTANL